MVAVKEIRTLLKMVFILTIFSIAGCGTVKFSSPSLEAEKKKEPVVTPADSIKPESPSPVAGKTEVVKEDTYQYGRFVVKVTEEGQRVLGGEFLPEKKLPASASERHVIFINHTTKELSYYRHGETTGYEPVVGYAVITPLPSFLPAAEVRGRVFKIDTTPWWCPTPNARKLYPQLPAGCLPPGHKDNAMGAVKFEVVWFDVDPKEWDTIRLHGTNGYPRGNFWDEETLGCTRLNDDAIKELVTKLGPRAVREGIEVVLLKGGDLPPASESAGFAL